MQVPCICWNLAGGFFRYFGNAIIIAYGLFYFNLYQKPDQYALITTIVFVVGGTFSPLFYAYLSDKLEPYNLKAKAYLASFQALFAASCYFALFYFFKSFTFAVTFVILEEFFAEGIVAPSLSMMTLTCPRGQDGNIMGLYMIITSIATLIPSYVLGTIVNETDPKEKIMFVLTWSIVPCFLLGSLCYFISGFDYEKRMTQMKEERTQALA